MLGAIVSTTALRDTDLNLTDIKLLLELSLAPLVNGLYTGDFKLIQHHIGVSMPIIKKSVKTLTEKGYINDMGIGYCVNFGGYDAPIKIQKKKEKVVALASITPEKEETYGLWKQLCNDYAKKQNMSINTSILDLQFNLWWGYWNHEAKWMRKGNKPVKKLESIMVNSFNFKNIIENSKKIVAKKEIIDYNKLSDPELYVELNKMFPKLKVNIAHNAAKSATKVGSYKGYPAKDNDHAVAIIKKYMEQDDRVLRMVGMLK